MYNITFPIIEHKIKNKYLNKPYITSSIRNSIKERNRLQKLYAKWPLTYEKQFKKYRNMLTNIIKQAKNNYHINSLTQNAGNASKTWNIKTTDIKSAFFFENSYLQADAPATPQKDVCVLRKLFTEAPVPTLMGFVGTSASSQNSRTNSYGEPMSKTPERDPSDFRLESGGNI